MYTICRTKNHTNAFIRYDIDMRTIITKILPVLLILSSACSSKPSDEEVPASDSGQQKPVYSSLGTIETEDDIIVPFNTTVRLETLSEDDMAVLDPVFQEEMLYTAKLFDRRHFYNDLINLASVNASYGSEIPCVTDSALFHLLEMGIELTELTDGKFNITIGAVYDLWKDRFSPFPIEGEDPAAEDIEAALACVVSPDEIRNVIELNPADSTVTFHAYDGCEGSVIIDAGAIGKGYAVDLAGEKLSSYDLPFLINSGSSSILSHTPEGIQKDWYIGIRNPYARVYTLFDYRLTGSGVFTASGDDSSYFILQTKDGPVIRHHILNPATGYPENYLRSAILSGSSAGWLTDALTTALFSCRSDEERLDMIRRAEQKYNVPLCYAWFEETSEEHGKLTASAEFRNQIIEESISENVTEITEAE